MYVHELKKLLDQAMPELDTGARDQLLLHQFLAGIPRDISKSIRAASDVKSFDKACERARLLMAVKSDATPAVAAVSDACYESQELRGQITELTEQVAMLTMQRRQLPRATMRCHNCGGVEHMRRECPARVQDGRRCFNCGTPGHMQRDCPKPQRSYVQGNDQGTAAPGNSRPNMPNN